MANTKKTDWYSSDEDDFKKSKIKKPKVESDVEEGELSSDNCDDLSLEKLFKDEDDRNRVLRMTEKEREEEIFKRSVELKAIKSRQKAAKKLNEQKKKQSNQRPMNKKRSLAEVFSHLSGDESIHSSSNDESSSARDNLIIPTKKSKSSPQPYARQKALDNQKSSQNQMLSQLNEIRKQRKEKAEKSIKNEESAKKPNLDSDSSDLEEKNINNVDRQSIISSSSSEQLGEQEEPDEDKFVETVDQLSKIRLTRSKMEKWVHMPFFKDLVTGCFVRVNIGEGPTVLPVYRCAEIIEVVETVKIYDLGSTRTNIGLKLRIGKSVTTFRLIFLSNQEFMTTEFDSWRRRVISDGTPLPKLSFIEEKARQIKEHLNYSIDTEETMKHILLSKQRFQKNPVNFAMRKAELTRLKLAAENDGDSIAATKFQDEIDELNRTSEKLERKRTTSIKNISYINQRNREITQNHVEKAIELEIAENREWEKIGGDPFLREPTKPVLNYRKKKLQEKAALEAAIKQESETNKEESEKTESNIKSDLKEESTSSTPAVTRTETVNLSKINFNNIHNFDLVLDIKEESNTTVGSHYLLPPATVSSSTIHNNSNSSPLPASSSSFSSSSISIARKKPNASDAGIDLTESILSAIQNSLSGNSSVAVNQNSNPTPPPSTSTSTTSSTSRRVLNLQDYKRRKGLI